MTVPHVRRYVDDARRELGDGVRLRWSTARERMRMQLAEDVRRQREDAGGAPSDAETARIARWPRSRDVLDQVWPALDPRGAAAPGSTTEPAFLARCAADALTEDEQSLLTGRPRAAAPAAGPPPTPSCSTSWTALIDGAPSFVHVVVDEAQDLSPMQCRAIARRCPLGSVTVLGDLAQATTPWAPGAWAPTLATSGSRRRRVRPLTAGYRVPGEVLELANRLLPHIAADVPPARSVRQGEDALALRADGGRTLSARGRGALPAPSRARSACIVPDARATARAGRSCEARRQSPRRAAGRATPTRASRSCRPAQAKGLEFDSVVLVEPAAIVAAEADPGRRSAPPLRRADPRGVPAGRSCTTSRCLAELGAAALAQTPPGR